MLKYFNIIFIRVTKQDIEHGVGYDGDLMKIKIKCRVHWDVFKRVNEACNHHINSKMNVIEMSIIRH